ncbi:DNA polymerase III subunit epsilon [Citricoccus zhacaiensis]|uniref:DNA polymerase III subunit epsilon n=1 Tax=Citricoccus zhacaiensis TaxID=489142 RepID=A0ABQ2LM87_9MICC|nr:exonuclease domain-containing protein [Citricoccus zhacaiensis]GGO39989.1 DNA polymerase III subunit epsilon [Citricoccus zhacaiensis]
MALDFTALDFETANGFRGSPCSVGLVRVRNGQPVERAYWLMRPPVGFDRFDARNVGIHGITAAQVAGAPRFADVFGDMADFIGSDPLVAHNAGFDIGVIESALEVSGRDIPRFDYACSLVMARRTYDLPSYALPVAAMEAGHPLENHHDALADAEACAWIMIDVVERRRAARQPADLQMAGLQLADPQLTDRPLLERPDAGAHFATEGESTPPVTTGSAGTASRTLTMRSSTGLLEAGLAEFLALDGVRLRQLEARRAGTSPESRATRQARGLGPVFDSTVVLPHAERMPDLMHWPDEGINPEPAADADPAHPLYGHTVVFTGNLGMPRQEAKNRAAAWGARTGSRVNAQTTMLVVGDGFRSEDLGAATRGGAIGHRKTRDALARRQQGQHVELVSEPEFLQMLDGNWPDAAV